MHSFLNKIKSIFHKGMPDAELIGEVKFHENNIPFFTVKMHGCSTCVDINAEEIVEKFTNKFRQEDIKKATKVFMKYRTLLRLVSIEKNFAILYNQKDAKYQLIDLSDNLFLRSLDLDLLRAEDAFKLGLHFERMRLEKDRRLFNLTRSGNNITQLHLVCSDD